MKNRAGKPKRHKIVLLSVLGLLVAVAAAFAIYVSDYYRADSAALALLQTDPDIQVQGNLTVFTPETPGDSALIFYPGGKVEASAYAPLLQQLKDRGLTCILVQMPFNLAVFGSNAADAIYSQFPAIKNWYVGGHSLGGAMASSYASGHPSSVEGLILLGAYLYGDYPAAKTLTVYGSFNTQVGEHVSYTDNVVVINGGNHAQFGDYGAQRGDPPATIARQQQQAIAVDVIMDFIDSHSAQ